MLIHHRVTMTDDGNDVAVATAAAHAATAARKVGTKQPPILTQSVAQSLPQPQPQPQPLSPPAYDSIVNQQQQQHRAA